MVGTGVFGVRELTRNRHHEECGSNGRVLSKGVIAMSYLSDEDFETAGRNLRVKLGIDDQFRLDLIDVLRRLKHQEYIVDYVRIPNCSMPDEEAKFDPDKRIIYVRESTYLAAEKGEERARWTIAHEVGHFALNHRKIRNRSSDPKVIEKIAPTIRRDESQAHRFAAAFLAPLHRAEFSPQTTAQQIAARFGISMQAAGNRLEELSRIYRRLRGIKRQLPNSVIDLLAEARRKGHKLKDPALIELVSESDAPLKYEGDACPCCSEFKLIRSGISMRCGNCGAVTGDD
jgi:Zn-dependent peptidase ImmA (M78 family)